MDKSRTTNAYPNHVLQDSVRGANKYLISDSNGVEGTNPTFGSFDANGFSLTTSNVTWNGSGSDYVAWCWKGSNADAVSNTVGDITSQVNNSDKGFSIVKWSGSGADETVGHGLTVNGTATTPELILAKRTNMQRVGLHQMALLWVILMQMKVYISKK